MKAKLALVGLLIAVLALVGVGCADVSGMGDLGTIKATGGGWFPWGDEDGNTWKVTFGFNAQYDTQDTPEPEDDVIKGQFQLVDHGNQISLHGTFETCTWIGLWGGFCVVKGKGELNGQSDVPFELQLMDMDDPEDTDMTGDMIMVTVGPCLDFPDGLFYAGYLEGGNIKFH